MCLRVLHCQIFIFSQLFPTVLTGNYYLNRVIAPTKMGPIANIIVPSHKIFKYANLNKYCRPLQLYCNIIKKNNIHGGMKTPYSKTGHQIARCLKNYPQVSPNKDPNPYQ